VIGHELYAEALGGGAPGLLCRDTGGRARPLPVDRWLGPAGPADERLLDRADGPVLDVGCGPGRHAHELARRGIRVHGVDVSERFVDLARAGAPPGATFERRDARTLAFDAEFDAVVCLCQGAFGLMTATGDDEVVLGGIANALRPGGGLALSAFNAYFAVRYHEAATFDADAGIAHERTEVKDPAGRGIEVDLWTGCYTPRELRLLLVARGLGLVRISSVEPGAYGDAPPTAESPEYLVIARRPP
jgi:SAM-dependent methyltransferase